MNEHKVRLAAFPEDLIAGARKQANDMLGELAGRSAITAKVHTSYAAFRALRPIEAVLRTRGV
jgi:TRAP-type mannitol/chloroaromatic compound transport system substrate-binding protein